MEDIFDATHGEGLLWEVREWRLQSLAGNKTAIGIDPHRLRILVLYQLLVDCAPGLRAIKGSEQIRTGKLNPIQLGQFRFAHCRQIRH